MSTISSRSALGLLLALLMSSCASERTALTLNTSVVRAEELIQHVNARAAGLHSMTGKGSLWYESPQAAGSAFFALSLRKPDSLLIRLKGPFGIEVGLLFLSRDRFIVYNGMANRVITGVPTDSSIRSMIPIKLTYDQIIDAFCGTFTPGRLDSGLLRYAIDDDHFLLSFVRGRDTCTYWIDPETQVVTKYVVVDDRGNTLVEAEAGSILERDGVYVPRTVQVRLQDQQLSIHYSSLDLNAPDVSFEFSIPPSARTSVR